MRQIEFDQPVYTFQVDYAQHVSNIVYIQWMEIARLKLLDEAGLPVHLIKKRGFVPVLTHTEINYRKPLVLGDKVRVVLWISELKRISATLNFQFFNQEDDLVADGVQVALFINLANQRPYRLPPEERARFEPYLEGTSA
jgi:acyl-CoA thioester hydrolase